MSEDPWSAVAIPQEEMSINARRVDETHKWDFYWGRDTERRCLLVLRHSAACSPRDRLPRLKGVDIFVQPGTSDIRPSLVLRLLDSTLRDVFHRLCSDIIESTSQALSEAEAVTVTVARTWRWHHLLRGGSSGLMSPEEQKGLLGELLVLERYMLVSLPHAAALTAWVGPLGAAKDFVIGHTGIESKAVGTANASRVDISSEHQLNDADMNNLFLHLSVFDAPTAATDEDFTVTDVATRIGDRLLLSGELLIERYNALLAAAGFRYEDDYSGSRWTGGERSIYQVKSGFPRLTPGNVPPGVEYVKYQLSVEGCGAFLVAPAVLHAALTGASHGRRP